MRINVDHGDICIAIFAIVALVLTMCHGAKAADRTPPMEYAFDAALAADMWTTLDIKHHHELMESNAMLGAHPSDTRVVEYGLVWAGVHFAVTRALINSDAPKPLIDTWEILTTAVHVRATVHNYEIGLRCKF